MELWLDEEKRLFGGASTSSIVSFDSPDKIIGKDIIIKSGKVRNELNQVIGAHVIIDNAESQSHVRSLLGCIDWVVIECNDWTMIPFENIISDAHHTPTKVAALINEASQVPGVAFALDIGVDALILPPDAEVWQAGCIARSQRHEYNEVNSIASSTQLEEDNGAVKFVEVTIESIEAGHIGDRVCIDFIGLLEKGEGIVVGSSSKLMGLIHGETIESEFVPTRPFRVNAGPVHSYTILANGKTAYLSEIKAGDSLKVLNFNGKSRPLAVGRVKTEPRPLILFRLLHQNTFSSNMFVQQAETVRLVRPNGSPLSVTEAKIGDEILAKVEKDGRHVGVLIKSKVDER